MVGRIWRGYTKPENADKYEALLKAEIFPQIAGKEVTGYRGIQLFREPDGKDKRESSSSRSCGSIPGRRRGVSPVRTTSVRTCPRERGRCWRGSTSIRATTRSKNISSTRETAKLRSCGNSCYSRFRPGFPRSNWQL